MSDPVKKADSKKDDLKKDDSKKPALPKAKPVLGEKLVLPVLPLRDIVVFPHMMVPLYVGRQKSIDAVEAALAAGGKIVLAAQKDAKTNEPSAEEIFRFGTIAEIVQDSKRPDKTIKILVQGKERVALGEITDDAGYFQTEATVLHAPDKNDPELVTLSRALLKAFDDWTKGTKRLTPDVIKGVKAIKHPQQLADTMAAHLSLKHEVKQEILEMASVAERLSRLHEVMEGELEVLQVEQKIRSRVKGQMERSEKEYYLNEQMRAIQKELGDNEGGPGELEELLQNLKEKEMPEDARERTQKEIKKLKSMSPMSAEATVVRNYADWCLALPWNKNKEVEVDLNAAEKILDEDHFGLEKPKERIVEYLAVQKLVKKLKGPILCFVGPPGVGKTSLARSIARSTGRDFVRQSLGGVRDEAEIRGHRRTYIGAMPGKIIQSLKRAGTSNPVFLLDEVDKMSQDFRGDPSSALLEVLDPEQNSTFVDHYLDLDYDLSGVMFICTANTLAGIPGPLQDRMEIIRLAGYTELEKLAIAERYLVPKQIKENGLTDIKIKWNEAALETIVQLYTREAGVRSLEREIGSICRKIAKEVVKAGDEGLKKKFSITPAKVQKYLGVAKYQHSKREEDSMVGVATGLAWTQVGGEILQIEVSTMPGKGKLTITGKLGDVMQESAQAAMTYVRSRSERWGLEPDFYSKVDIHIHVPEGATPKDGPSAGITMTTALVSAFTGIPVRSDLAMTGEITLRGRVLPIGGLKEKSLAAHRVGITELVIPKDNAKDIEDIPKSIRDKIKINTVENLDEVLEIALAGPMPQPYKAPKITTPEPVIDAHRAH